LGSFVRKFINNRETVVSCFFVTFFQIFLILRKITTYKASVANALNFFENYVAKITKVIFLAKICLNFDNFTTNALRETIVKCI
jgi:hypothetical protein